MNPFTEPNPTDEAHPDRANLIAVTEPLTSREQQALDAALFERTRYERLELAVRRALLALGRRNRLDAILELQNALLK